MQHSLQVTRNHPSRGPEVVGVLEFGDVIDFFVSEEYQFVLRPITDRNTNQVVGFDLVPYPEHYEMRQD